MTIYVDGDACPVKEETYRVAARYAIPVVLVANAPLRVPDGGGVRLVRVAGGPNVTDDWIAVAAGAGDIVLTADLPLAGRALDSGAVALDFRGVEFTDDSIGGLLASREIAQLQRAAESFSGGPKPFNQRDRGRFSGKLDAVVNRLLRRLSQ
ncbi:MAG: YaiI/YqxD family protein [Dehalococcoidia bacterium]